MFTGNAAILLGAAGSAFYNTYGKKVLETYSELETLIYGYVIAATLCALISLALDPVPFYAVSQWPARAWFGVAVLGALSWGIGMVIWMWLLHRLEVAQVSVSVYMLPVLGVLLSTIILFERITWTQALGGLIVLSSAYACSAQPANSR
jgi:drug/metabolite transporter (DMT)-like permease